jgi:hypothetical protein
VTGLTIPAALSIRPTRPKPKMKTLDPLAWRLFQRFTLELIDRGFAHYSSDAVLHRVRWETAVSARVGGFKVNNNLAPLYARMFHETYPAHDGFFRMRVSKYDVALPPGAVGLIVGSIRP